MTVSTINTGYERPKGHYIRHVELTETELDTLVEYDMDEQDKFWLQAYNQNRQKEKQKAIDYDTFEFVMDRLEKEWFELTKDIPKQDPTNPAAFTDDQPCQICLDSECDNTNAIVFCDGCNLAVHQDCYGIPYIPEGQWLCRKCMLSPEKPVSCIFCPNEGGAFKQTTTNKWAHLLCALWIPEVQIVNPVYMEPIDAVEDIPRSRWKLVCSICKIRKGACIQCCHKFCFTAFHVTCARKSKYYMKIKDLLNVDDMRVYCARHRPRNMKDRNRHLSNDQDEDAMNSPENMASIDMTAVSNGEEISDITEDSNGNSNGNHNDDYIDEDEEDSNESNVKSIDNKDDMIDEATAMDIDNDKVNNDEMDTYSIVGKKRKSNAISEDDDDNEEDNEDNEDDDDRTKAARAHSHHFLTRAPMVPYYIAHRILQGLGTQVGQRNQFVRQMCKYWALKREMRRGAPLLKRLHLEPWTAYASAQTESDKEKGEKYASLVYLRADLEKIRLLTEMIRRREREKLRLAQLRCRYFEIVAFPLQLLMRQVIDSVQRRDIHNIFANPVSIEDVPDYLDIIKEPMDFSTIRKKLDSCAYRTLDEFEHDLGLIYSNAVIYNKPVTYYYKLAKRLQYATTPLLRELRERVAILDIDKVGDVIDRSIIDDILTTPDASELNIQRGFESTRPLEELNESHNTNTNDNEDNTTKTESASSHKENVQPLEHRKSTRESRRVKEAAIVQENSVTATTAPTRHSRRISAASTSMDTNKRTSNQPSISNKKSSKQASSSSSKSSQSAHSLRKQRTSKRVALSSGDIVWAKMPGFPWFPAELVQPSKSIPDSVMNYREPNKDRLVCFFDKHMKQRSWQWLATKDLQPLGRDDTIDLRHLKLTDYRRDKRRIRLSVKAAYIAACEAMTEENGQPVDPQRLLSQLK